MFLKLFDECLHVCSGLLVGEAAKIIQVPLYDQAGDACCLLQPLRHSVAAIGIVRTGLRIMINDAVDFEDDVSLQ